MKGWADTWKLWIFVGWKLDCVGTKDTVGMKVVFEGTKLLDEALKGLHDTLETVCEGDGVNGRGLDYSLHVDTSVEAAEDCAEFRSENCD